MLFSLPSEIPKNHTSQELTKAFVELYHNASEALRGCCLDPWFIDKERYRQAVGWERCSIIDAKKKKKKKPIKKDEADEKDRLSFQSLIELFKSAD